MNSAALLTALLARKATGRGTDIDVSAVEAGVELLDALDVAVNKRTTRNRSFPTGNRLEHPNAAPHGAAATGTDRWGRHRRVRRCRARQALVVCRFA